MRIARRIAISVIVVALAGLAATGVTLWHKGYRAYIVHTGSMVPTLNPGDLVVDKPVTTLHKGEVISFRHDLTPDVVTHRIRWYSHGVISTKGDANATKDAWFIRPDQVQGTEAVNLPKLGYVAYFFKQKAGVAAAMTALLALIMLWGLFFPAQVATAAAAAATLTGINRLRGNAGPRHRSDRGSAVAALRSGGAAAGS
jgi:signal peptidase